MITWVTDLCNSMKLWAMPCRATQDGWVMAERWNKTWSTGEGNGKPFNGKYTSVFLPWDLHEQDEKGRVRNGVLLLNKYRVSVSWEEKICELMAVTTAQCCECFQCHWCVCVLKNGYGGARWRNRETSVIFPPMDTLIPQQYMDQSSLFSSRNQLRWFYH